MTFQFETLSDFLMMAGHGPYVWASYFITLLAVVIIVIIPTLQKKSLAKQVQRQQRIESTNRENLKERK